MVQEPYSEPDPINLKEAGGGGVVKSYLWATEHSTGMYFSSFLLAFESASVFVFRDLRSAKTWWSPLLRTTWQLALKTRDTGLSLATSKMEQIKLHVKSGGEVYGSSLSRLLVHK